MYDLKRMFVCTFEIFAMYLLITWLHDYIDNHEKKKTKVVCRNVNNYLIAGSPQFLWYDKHKETLSNAVKNINMFIAILYF